MQRNTSDKRLAQILIHSSKDINGLADNQFCTPKHFLKTVTLSLNLPTTPGSPSLTGFTEICVPMECSATELNNIIHNKTSQAFSAINALTKTLNLEELKTGKSLTDSIQVIIPDEPSWG